MGFWRILLFFVVVCLLVSASPAQTNLQPDAPTLRVTSTLVFLDVTVLDKKGHPVNGLTKEDFSITEDKKPQRIFSFEAPEEHLSGVKEAAGVPDHKEPVTIIVLDLLNSEFDDFAYIRYSVRHFLQSQPERLSMPTEMLVIGNQSLDMLQGFTRSRSDLLYALSELPPALPYKRMNGSFFWERFVQSLEALQQIALQNTGVQGRKNVIWVGHGGPNITLDSVFFPGKTEERVKQFVHSTANLLVDARVSLFVIYPGLPVGAPPISMAAMQANADVGETDPFAGDINFGLFVNETGGKLFYNRNDVDAEINRSEQLGSDYYTLTYQPQNVVPDGEFRRIHVRLRNAFYHVVTKAGYYARSADEASNPLQKQMTSISSAVRAAIPFNLLAVEITNVVRHPDTRTVEFTANLKSKDLNFIHHENGATAAQVLAGVASLDQDRSILASRLRLTRLTSSKDLSRLPDVAWQTRFMLPLSKRTQWIRLAIVDEDGGRVGSAEIDRKQIQNAPVLPTPRPTLLPGNSGIHR